MHSSLPDEEKINIKPWLSLSLSLTLLKGKVCHLRSGHVNRGLADADLSDPLAGAGSYVDNLGNETLGAGRTLPVPGLTSISERTLSMSCLVAGLVPPSSSLTQSVSVREMCVVVSSPTAC